MYKKRIIISLLLSICFVLQGMNKDAKYYLKFHDEKISINRAGLERIRVCSEALHEYEELNEGQDGKLAEFTCDLDSWLKPHAQRSWVKQLKEGDIRSFVQFAMGNVEVGALGGGLVLAWIHCADILNATRFGDFKPDRDLLVELITGLSKKLNQEDARLIFDKKGLWWDILAADFSLDILNDMQKIIFAKGPRVIQTIDKPLGAAHGIKCAELSDGRFACTGCLVNGVLMMDLATGKLKKVPMGGLIPYSIIGLSDKNLVVCGQKTLSVICGSSEYKVDKELADQVVESANPVLVALDNGKFAISLWEPNKKSILHIFGPVLGSMDVIDELKEEKQFTFDGRVSSLILVPGAGLAMSFHDTSDMLMVDPESGEKLHTLTAPDNYKNQTFFVFRPGFVASCSMGTLDDNESWAQYVTEIDIWNAKTGKLQLRKTDLGEHKWEHVQLLPNENFIATSAGSSFSIMNDPREKFDYGIEDLVVPGLQKHPSSLLVLHDGTVVTTPFGKSVQISEVVDYYEGLDFEQSVIVKALRQCVVKERAEQLKKMMNVNELLEIFIAFSKTKNVNKIMGLLQLKMPEIKSPKVSVKKVM